MIQFQRRPDLETATSTQECEDDNDGDDDADGVDAGDDDVCECYNNTCNIRRHPQRQLQSPWSAPFFVFVIENFHFFNFEMKYFFLQFLDRILLHVQI